jgi:hypothetical protein
LAHSLDARAGMYLEIFSLIYWYISYIIIIGLGVSSLNWWADGYL